METEPRILVYEGRRYLRPDPEPKVLGAKEMGFTHWPQLLALAVAIVAPMVGFTAWAVHQLRTGAIRWDNPFLAWALLGMTFGPIVALYGFAVKAANRKSKEKPDLPPNPVRIMIRSKSLGEFGRALGSLSLTNGFIQVGVKGGVIQINRWEVERVTVSYLGVGLCIAPYHAVPAMTVFIRPLNGLTGRICSCAVLKELKSEIEAMSGSSRPSTYPALERRTFRRPPGAYIKGAAGSFVVMLALAGLAAVARDPAARQSSVWEILTVCLLMGLAMPSMLFLDPWLAEVHNRWLRKKGIVRD